MAIRTVTYIVSCPVPCYTQVPAEVILCVPSSKVLSGNSTIEATLSTVIKEGSCGQCLYKHVFTYDDAQLVEDATIFSTDISGVICRDCLTSYIDQQAGTPVNLVTPPQSEFLAPIQLVNQYGTTFTFPFQRVFDLPIIVTNDATPFQQPFLAPFLSPGKEYTFSLEIDVVARRTGRSAGAVGDAAAWKILVAAKFVGGIVSFIGSPAYLLTAKDQGAMDVVLSVAMNLGIINLTGTANNTFSWQVRVKDAILDVS